MADILLDTQVRPATPGANTGVIFVDSVAKRIGMTDDTGMSHISIYKASVANQTGFAADTYLVGSSFVISAGTWQAKTLYRCKFDMSKTAAGTGTFAVNIRLGTLGTTGDASVCAMTFAAGTAAIDTGIFVVEATFRTVGSGTSAVVVLTLWQDRQRTRQFARVASPPNPSGISWS